MATHSIKSQSQQTIKLAIDCETGELVSAAQLLAMSQAEFSTLRHDAMEARVQRKRGGDSVRFRCAICKQPLWLARYYRGNGNRWFVHDGPSEHCPWHEGNRLTPEQMKALIYRGQQESTQHRAMKQFLADWLSRDPSVTDINLEQTTYSEVVEGEWRRPDVKCIYGGKRVVFEVQLSYTFLSEVIARDEFYRRDGIFIIWVFAKFEPDRAVVTDEAYFNHRNLFVLDEEARALTAGSGSLTFSGFRQIPTLKDKNIEDVWTNEPVALRDVTFPTETYRPYFFDYDAAYRIINDERKEFGQTRTLELDSRADSSRAQFSNAATLELLPVAIQSYVHTALRYYECDYSKEIKAKLLRTTNVLSGLSLSPNALAGLRNDAFYGYHGVLPVLLSIKLNRNIGFDPRLSVFQIIEAGLRNTHNGYSQHAFAILYLSAYRQYQPNVTNRSRQWLSDKSNEVKASIKSGEAKYRRFGGYDDSIRLIFPELEHYLASGFGLNTIESS